MELPFLGFEPGEGFLGIPVLTKTGALAIRAWFVEPHGEQALYLLARVQLMQLFAIHQASHSLLRPYTYRVSRLLWKLRKTQ
jgi:hypothetical protein